MTWFAIQIAAAVYNAMLMLGPPAIVIAWCAKKEELPPIVLMVGSFLRGVMHAALRLTRLDRMPWLAMIVGIALLYGAVLWLDEHAHTILREAARARRSSEI